MMIAVTPSWWVYLVAVGILAILILLDVKSRAKRGRYWRVIAFVLILLSFLGLYMKPHVQLDKEEAKVVLVTDSSVPMSTDSLEQEGFKAMDFDTYLKIADTKNITEMIMVGDGLEEWELDQMQHSFKYSEPKQMMEGPLEMSINEVVANTLSSLTFRLWVNEPTDVHLSGTGIESKLQHLQPEDQAVTFEVNPQVVGSLIYELIGVRESDTLFTEVVPIRVAERTGYNTLILTNTPSFEIRFLKNLLKEEGYGVAERLQLSKGTFRESFSNLETRSLTRLTKTMLQEFKVVITDKVSYDQLSYAEKQNLNSALKMGSLGVVWMDDASNDWLKAKSVKAQTMEFKSKQQSVELATGGVTSTGFDRQVNYQGNNIGHLHTYGLGKVILPFMRSTYQLKLKGYDDLYSELWNAMMKPVIGFYNSATGIKLQAFPRKDEPVEFIFKSSALEPVFLDSIRLSMKEKWHQPGVFTTVTWPKQRGWNTHKIGDATHSFFVFDPTDWQAQKIHQKRIQTATYAQKKWSNISEITEVERPVSKWIFFFMIVLSLSFLWVEQRLG